jgi:hypothetical protein
MEQLPFMYGLAGFLLIWQAATQAFEAPSTPAQYLLNSVLIPSQYRRAMTVMGIESVLNGLLKGILRPIIGQLLGLKKPLKGS